MAGDRFHSPRRSGLASGPHVAGRTLGTLVDQSLPSGGSGSGLESAFREALAVAAQQEQDMPAVVMQRVSGEYMLGSEVITQEDLDELGMTRRVFLVQIVNTPHQAATA